MKKDSAGIVGILGPASQFLKDLIEIAGPGGFRACVLVAAGAVLEGIGLVLVVPILGVVMDSGASGAWAQAIADFLFGLFGVQTRFSRLVLLLSLLILLMLIRAVVLSARNVTIAKLEIGFVQALQSRIVSRLGSARWEQVSHLRHARISHLMSGDIQRIGGGAHFFLQGSIAVVMLVCQCILAVALSPLLAGLSLVLIGVSGVALFPMLRRARELGEVVSDANLALLNGASQFLGGLKLAVSQGLQSRFVSEFNDTLYKLGQREVEFMRQYSNNRLAVATLGTIVAAIAVVVGFAILGATPPVLLTLLLVLSRMSGPATTVQSCAQYFVLVLPAYEKVKSLERELQLAEATTDEAAVNIPEGPIVFRDVSFQHIGRELEDASERGIRNLDLTIAPHGFIGITGSSGAGKTTFADLLVGLFSPSAGEIFIGGMPLTGAAIPSWRRQISYVSQDPFLFHDTIRRNLQWANAHATENDLLLALETAGAGPLVKSMPQGLDTVVGERGTLVSGGERQRIALARALVRKPRMLVLDEATNAIDVAGEREIIERIVHLQPRMTIVMIAHRAESLALCDRVLVFDSGKIKADGSFATFLSQLEPDRIPVRSQTACD